MNIFLLYNHYNSIFFTHYIDIQIHNHTKFRPYALQYHNINFMNFWLTGKGWNATDQNLSLRRKKSSVCMIA